MTEPDEPNSPAANTPGPHGIVAVPQARTVVPAATPSLAKHHSSTMAEKRDTLRPIRRDARVGPPPRHPLWMLNQLPVGMMESDFFVRFVSIFQEMGNTLLDGADLLEHVPDVSVTPTPLLPHLASWIGVESVDPSLPENLQRVLVKSSARALAWRGTASGIKSYLEMLSGETAEVIDSGGVWPEGQSPGGPAWVRMTIGGTGHLSEDELVAMIRDEVPAHVRAELWVGVRRIWSNVED